MDESWLLRRFSNNFDVYCYWGKDTLQRTVGGVVKVLLAENSIVISVRIIFSSKNKCCLWERTLRIVLALVKLCDDSVTAFFLTFFIRRKVYWKRIPSIRNTVFLFYNVLWKRSLIPCFYPLKIILLQKSKGFVWKLWFLSWLHYKCDCTSWFCDWYNSFWVWKYDCFTPHDSRCWP